MSKRRADPYIWSSGRLRPHVAAPFLLSVLGGIVGTVPLSGIVRGEGAAGAGTVGGGNDDRARAAAILGWAPGYATTAPCRCLSGRVSDG